MVWLKRLCDFCKVKPDGVSLIDVMIALIQRFVVNCNDDEPITILEARVARTEPDDDTRAVSE